MKDHKEKKLTNTEKAMGALNFKVMALEKKIEAVDSQAAQGILTLMYLLKVKPESYVKLLDTGWEIQTISKNIKQEFERLAEEKKTKLNGLKNDNPL